MASTAGKEEDPSSSNGELKWYRNSAQKSYLMAQFMLRILAIASAIASICVMVSSHQTVLIFGIYTTARYRYSSAYRFLVGADAVASGFCVLSMVFLWRLCNSKTQHIKSFFYMFLHDMVMMVLVGSGCAAATAIGYVGRFGEEKINWNAVCDYVGKFCNQILAAVILSYISFFCYITLTTLSAHKLMSLPK